MSRMRLLRIEALRYGALCDSVLGPFAPGLNVVLGPNEAGKSTYTALVRHVLYGFPDRRRAERGYRPISGDSRAGRLVFADDDGSEWVLTRSGESGGGEVSLLSPDGPAEPEPFLASITSGVSEDVYRQVFGFSLGELAEFDSLEGIRAHLLASVAGLETDPHAVLAELEKRRNALYLPTGRTKVIHKLLAELRQNKTDRRALEAEAESFASQREDVARLSEELAEARSAADTADLRSRALAALVVRMEDARERAGQAREDRAAIEARIASLSDEADAIVVDESIADRADTTLSLAERMGDLEAALEELRESRAEAGTCRSRADEALEKLGDVSPERLRQLANDVDLETSIEEHAAAIGRARDAVDRATEEGVRAEGAARSSREVAERAADAAGVDPAGGLGALIAASDVRAADVSAVTRPPATLIVAAAASALIAVILVLAGMALDSTAIAIAGVVVLFVAAGASVAVAVVALRARPATPGPSSSNAHAVEEARVRLGESETAERALDGAREQLAAAEQRVAEAEQAWCERAREAGIPEDASPAESRAFMLSARQAADARDRGAEAAARAERAEQAVMRYTQRASEAGIDVGGSPEALPALLRQAASEAERHGEAKRLRDEVRTSIASAREELGRANARLDRASEDMSAVLAEGKVSTDSELEAAAAAGVEETATRRRRAEELAEQRATVMGVLGDEGREDRQAALSLDAARSTELLRSSMTEYTIASIAAEMLAETLRVYERERQPGVVRRAEELFASITDGRYGRLRSPVGTFDPSIVDGSGESKGKEQLSTGTAQQLYLALRLAYLESLGGSPDALPVLMDDVLVNFDEERRHETARLLAEFAASHQTIFFTCHEATAEELSAVAPDGTVRLELTHC